MFFAEKKTVLISGIYVKEENSGIKKQFNLGSSKIAGMVNSIAHR